MNTYVHVWMHVHIYVTHVGHVSNPCVSRTKSLKQKLIYTLTILYTTIYKNIPSAAQLFTYRDKLTAIRESFHSMYN